MLSRIIRIFGWPYATRVDTLINEAELLQGDIQAAQDALVERLGELQKVSGKLRMHFFS